MDSGSNPPEVSPALKGSGRHTSTSSLKNVDDLLLALGDLGLEEKKPEGRRSRVERGEGGRRWMERGKDGKRGWRREGVGSKEGGG